jgi:hypothetical protein
VRKLSLWALAAAALAGCGGGVSHPPYTPQATTALVAIDTGPPPGRVETVPKRPAGADAWLDGEWILRHGRWYWLLGRWVATPRGATFSPWVVVRAPDGTLYYAPGAWHDAKGGPLAAPQPLAVATASGEAIFSPEGELEETGRTLKTPPARHGGAGSSPSPPPSPSPAPPPAPSPSASPSPAPPTP